VCVCSLRYPACYAHAPYCHMWPVRLYNIFPHLSHKRHDFRNKKIFNTRRVSRFSVQLSCEILLDAFAKLRKVTFSFVMSVGPSVCPLGTVGPPSPIKLYISISMFHRAFFNSIIDKHQHMQFFTFKTVLV